MSIFDYLRGPTGPTGPTGKPGIIGPTGPSEFTPAFASAVQNFDAQFDVPVGNLPLDTPGPSMGVTFNSAVNDFTVTEGGVYRLTATVPRTGPFTGAVGASGIVPVVNGVDVGLPYTLATAGISAEMMCLDRILNVPAAATIAVRNTGPSFLSIKGQVSVLIHRLA